MKRFVLFLLSLSLSVVLFAQSPTAKVEAIRHHNGRTIWVLDNGYQIWEENVSNMFMMVDPSGRCLVDLVEDYTWSAVQVGRVVKLKEIKGIRKSYPFYVPVKLKDYTVERTVVQVKRYTLKTRQGAGFFVNLYFKGIKQPVSVDINENPLWLEIQPGMKVKERRINGNIYYSPRF